LERRNGDRRQGSEQLDVDRATAAYVRSGRFSAEQMMTFLSGGLSRAVSRISTAEGSGRNVVGLAAIRVGGGLFVYESAVNKIIEDKPAVLMWYRSLFSIWPGAGGGPLKPAEGRGSWTSATSQPLAASSLRWIL
jgi:hypothetical protein